MLTTSSSSSSFASGNNGKYSSGSNGSGQSFALSNTTATDSHHQQQQSDQNIQVVVRVRPKSEKECRENNPSCIASIQSASGKSSSIPREISIECGGPGVTRTYSFDRVFSPETTQSDIYAGVVAPMLHEVLTGYNCTIFAYGQTGTGKTYTMEGDLSGSVTSASGIIPRTLFALFDALEGGGEFSVRVSFIELYNEELRDLLSGPEDTRKLRVFDDAARKGSVMVQGVEEVLVKNAQDVMAVLQRGSQKRSIATTRLNEMSSRSHGIFSITVHIKESTPEGEELLKVGKLNLVDLAGSENISRSGAENKRAKEAGMINQSLLTLGRVINALVERSPHIPYRESKLTRLLQDSLGGRTKTCIIAAISPCRASMEETSSTLDYAHRAKNIRNKPEVNQRLTKRALIKEYINEIELLKSDLSAARERNGIFLSPESYAALTGENESQREALAEAQKADSIRQQAIEDLQARVSTQEDEIGQLKRGLLATKRSLKQSEEDLSATKDQLLDVQNSLVQQTILTAAHRLTEQKLFEMGRGLVSSLKQSIQDCSSVHGDVVSLIKTRDQNIDSFSAFKDNLCLQLANFTSSLNAHSDMVANLISACLIANQSSQSTLANNSIFANLQIAQADFIKLASEHRMSTTAAGESLHSSMTKIISSIKVFLSHGLNSDIAPTWEECERAITTWEGNLTAHTQALDHWESDLVRLTRNLQSSQSRQISALQENTDEKLSMIMSYFHSHVQRLQQELESNSARLAEYEIQEKAGLESVLSQIRTILTHHSAERLTAVSAIYSTTNNHISDSLARVADQPNIVENASTALKLFVSGAKADIQLFEGEIGSLRPEETSASNLAALIDPSLVSNPLSVHHQSLQRSLQAQLQHMSTSEGQVISRFDALGACHQSSTESLVKLYHGHQAEHQQLLTELVSTVQNELTSQQVTLEELSRHRQEALQSDTLITQDIHDKISREVLERGSVSVTPLPSDITLSHIPIQGIKTRDVDSLIQVVESVRQSDKDAVVDERTLTEAQAYVPYPWSVALDQNESNQLKDQEMFQGEGEDQPSLMTGLHKRARDFSTSPRGADVAVSEIPRVHGGDFLTADCSVGDCSSDSTNSADASGGGAASLGASSLPVLRKSKRFASS